MKMKKGINILSSFLFLLLLTSYANAETCPDGSLYCCNNCHTEKSCGHAACDSCHGNPPTKNVVDRNDKGGLVWYPSQTGSTSAGAHLKHATLSGMNYSCSECHYNGMQTPPVQLNSKIEIGFNPGTDTNYDGRTTLNPPYDYQGTNGTTITRNETLACSNIYCHSNSTGGTKNIGGATTKSDFLNKVNDPRPVAPSTSPSWTATGPLGCDSCHGYPPSYPTDYPKANSHTPLHDGYTTVNKQCNVCHYATTHDGATIFDPSKHGNGIYDVVPDPTYTNALGPINFTYSYDAGGGQCSTISCHGSGSLPELWSRIGRSVIMTRGSGTTCFQVNFTASANSNSGPSPYTYDWNWGDGTSTSGTSSTLPVSTAHTYANSGTYLVEFLFRDGNYHPGDYQTQLIINPVNAYPVANGTVSVAGYAATLTDLSYDSDYNTCGHSGEPGTIRIEWGDGTTTQQSISLTDMPSNQQFTHTYAYKTTIYQVYIKLYITDNAGKKAGAGLGWYIIPK